MLRRVRITKAALAGSAVAVCFLVFGTVCSVDQAGLSGVDASASGGGSGGKVSAAGGSSGTGGTLGGSGGASPTTGGSAGTNPTGGSGGTNVASGAGGGSGGTVGLGGAIGTGGDSSSSGGDQGNGSAGDQGTGGDGSGTGGGSGGATATGGAQGTGGAAGSGTGGTQGTGGIQGTGGMIGTGGAGGSHPPSCASFPTGSMFMPPTETVPHCYWTHSEAATWETAEATCEKEGGTLATILSSMENMAVLQLALRGTLFAGGTNVAWLGATDGKQSNDKSGPGKYAWVTGEAWGYTNWHSSQPDGSCTCQLNNMCACDHWLAIANDGTWYDRDDSNGRPYVCEAVAR